MNVTDGSTYVTQDYCALPVIAKGNNPEKQLS
jgi:hypothetical protein